jgi:Acetyltransferase (GNAT) domain
MAIAYLPYNDIDKKKWDACIAAADNSLVYAGSMYLDAMAQNWDALILDDYKAVMPLTWKKKYSIHYLYQPFFTSSLGVFGKNISPELLNDFLQHIPAKFKYWDIYLNHGNFFTLPGFKLYERMNYVLPLNELYEKLYAAYRDNIKRNIKKAEKLGCFIKKDFSVDDVIALAEQQSKTFAPITKDDFARFKKLYAQLHAQKQAITYGVYTASKELVASCVFFFYGDRAYYILVGNHPNGKTIGASHALINAFIKDHAGKNMLLDFEGSDIRNLAFFYSSFGAVEEKYAGLKYNNLPGLMKLFKK